jgi:hypothetical protein
MVAVGGVALVLQEVLKVGWCPAQTLLFVLQAGPQVELGGPEVVTLVEALTFVDATCVRAVGLAGLESIEQAITTA